MIYNPIAGRGRAGAIAQNLARHLGTAGHRVELLDRGPASRKRDITPIVAASQAMVIVGGDGSVHAVAPLAKATGTPIYQVPTGTENLFAREFGMDRNPRTLLDALTANRSTPIDLGVCNGRPFLLMCSVGFDANVVHRLARVRSGPIRHASYLRHILAEFGAHAFERLSVQVDGRCVVQNCPGFLVVANSRQYAMRLDPATRADMSDQLLDVVFTPFESRARLTTWTLAMRLRTHLKSRGLVYERGREIRVEGPGMLYQLDGDAPGLTPGDSPPLTPLDIRIDPTAIRVLLPVQTRFTCPAVGSACSGVG